MIERLITWSANNRFLVLLLTGIAVFVGVWATVNTPVDALPDLSDVQVIIRTEFAGQAPQIVEEQVTYPLASAMMAVPMAKTVRGYSMFGSSFVYIIFEDGTDLYWARSRVLEYLSFAAEQLPANVKPSLGPDATGLGWVFEYSLQDSTGRMDLADLRSFQDFFLKYELQAVDGVSEVASVGGFVKQYQIVVDPAKMSAYGVPLSRIKSAVQSSNQDVGGRILEMGEREFMIRGRGYLQSSADIRAVPLISRSGAPITVGDVATVMEGPELRRGITDVNGTGEVVGGIVVMRFGENARSVIADVRARLDELKPGLPPGLKINTEYDRSGLIDEAVSTLSMKIWEELLVVALIVLLFLMHVRSAFVALVTVPVGILLALSVMYLLGINANIMSLGGIAIAVGVMVDASLVMVENAHKHLERFKEEHNREPDSGERFSAVLDAAREVGPSLFFSLLIVTVSFLPVFTLEQVEGRLFRPLALTKTFSMAAAAMLAVTLVPALMATFIRGKIRSEQQNPISRFFIAMYRPIIRWTLRNPKTVLVGGFSLLILTLLPIQRMTFDRVLIPFPQIGSEFMPPLNEGNLLYMPTTLPGVSPQKAKEILQQTDRIIASFPEVERVFGKAGRAATATDPAPLSMIETTIILKPRSEWRPGMSTRKLIQELDAAIQIPGLTNSWTMPIRARIDMLATGIRTPVGIKIAGPDLNELERIGIEIESVIQKVPGNRSVFAERVMGGSYLDVDVRTDEASRYGLSSGDVLSVLASAVGGMNIATTVEGLERYPINLRYPRALRDNLPALHDLPVVTPAGPSVPLGQLARLSLSEGAPMVKSENARPNAWIYVDLEDGVDVGTFVQSARAAVLSEITLPAGYSVRWSGQYEYMERATRRLTFLIPITLVIIFLLLFIHFRNAGEALLLMIPLPFALVGAVWLMTVLGYNMSVAVGVGLIAVAGLAAETGIVMHVYLDEAVKRYIKQGRMVSITALKQALQEGAVDRVRPKLMTVFTTLIGLLPVMIGAESEVGTSVMQRIATPMVGGLVTSTLHTLIMIPALYAVVQGRKLKPMFTETETSQIEQLDHEQPD